MTRTMSITMPDEDFRLIHEYCKELDITVSGLMRKCTTDYIKKHIRQVRLI